MIRTRGLCRNFGAFAAVQNLDLNVPASCVYGFLGPNGAGKTTTIRMLTGLLKPGSGSIRARRAWIWPPSRARPRH